MEINLLNVCCGYKRADILQNLNINFTTGQFYCILGANGIGKTTLFKTLLGFLDVKKGRILIDGKDISEMSSQQIAQYISYVPQAKNYSYQYSVLDIVLMGRAMYIKKFGSPSKVDENAAVEALRKLDILHLKDKMYSELSGGEQQIVLIARALVQEAQFIVMDEPASNLDYENQKKVLDVLAGLAQNHIGVIMSSHSPDHAFYCDARALLVFKDKSFVEGSCIDVITEENLLRVYGVKVKVMSQQEERGKTIRCCYLSST